MATYALIDGNSFYASCQMAFDPSLWQKPVVVLSNNDGCIVSANAKAKALDKQLTRSLGDGGYRAATPGSFMFQPYFKVKALLEQHQTVAFSSNYELYADMSNRMHTIIGTFGPHQEIYSIDESFLNLTGLESQDLTALGQEIKQTVFQWLHLPVAVGIGATKTLAKLANHLAKNDSNYQGVLDLNTLSPSTKNWVFKHTDVGKVWGVGKKMSANLKSNGIRTVYDLQQANPGRIRRRYSITLEKIVRELNGECCLSSQELSNPKQQIISSRSFGQAVTDVKSMEQALVSHTANAAKKLRQQNGVCDYITLYFKTDSFNRQASQYQPSHTLALPYASDDTILLAKAVKQGLRQIWRPGYPYKKAGVILSGLSPKGPVQQDCFLPAPDPVQHLKHERLMQLTDRINLIMGDHTLYHSSEGIKHKTSWQMNRNLMSGRYTTRWNELPKV
ncbi:MAG: Y-family DNA polymerase [Hydrogenovibrio sp.]|nr:Y-family DNA polymerase [Hydrogenovibrio sp.]